MDLSNGYNLLTSYTTPSGATVCEFNRSATVPSGSENLMHDLTDPIYVLYAAGTYTSDSIDYHGGTNNDRSITITKEDLTPSVIPPVRKRCCNIA